MKQYVNDGIQELYDSVNDRRIITEYKNGKKHGTERHYQEGILLTEILFKDGIRHGLQIDYYIDGTIKRCSIYLEGVKQGKETKYFDNGTLYQSAMYVNGKMHGFLMEYDKYGSLVLEQFYDDGLLIKELK